MRITLPLVITFYSKADEKKADLLLLLIHKKLNNKEYQIKLAEIISEAENEVIEDIKSYPQGEVLHTASRRV